VSERRMELVADLVARTARTRALRAATLDHEAIDHAVEGETVVESLLHKVDEILRGDRRTILEQLDVEVALARAEFRGAVRHVSSSLEVDGESRLKPLVGPSDVGSRGRIVAVCVRERQGQVLRDP